MAYTAGKLHLSAGAPGKLTYFYDAQSDTMAQVAVSGYFNNSDDVLALAVDDIIFAVCADGDVFLRVVSLSSGAVTTVPVAGSSPHNGTVGASSGSALSVGDSEIGTGTASSYVAPAPVIGAEFSVVQTGTATAGLTIAGSATTTVFTAAGATILTLTGQGAYVRAKAISATRYRIIGIGGTVTFS